ncbi:MAG: tRNA (guanosine(46)-N7)-methyltransferase TrmB [Tissierellia bacterium]|nr:tRNA (guanosine(46)-N7)-methyltransferase TrmB [Tissierellia bacterium]
MGRGFRLRGIDNIDERLEQIPYLLSLHQLEQFGEIFPLQQDTYLEIGMGLGSFIHAKALRHPDRNFIGLDRAAILLLKASERLEELPNLRFVLGNFESIHHLFPDQSLSGIFLNFSDPWPKKRHHKRRLTHRRFLDYYDRLLKPGGELHFKTDRADLFDFSLEEFQATSRQVYDVTRDLHHDSRYPDNIVTEYEDKFSQLGHPIHALRYVKT